MGTFVTKIGNGTKIVSAADVRLLLVVENRAISSIKYFHCSFTSSPVYNKICVLQAAYVVRHCLCSCVKLSLVD